MATKPPIPPAAKAIATAAAPPTSGGGSLLPTTSELFKPTPTVHHEAPEGFDESDVSLQDLQQVERTILQHPSARFTTAQRIFFEHLLAEPDMDTKKAAKKAGVSLAKATRWLSNPDTRQLLNHLITRRYQAAGITPTQVTRKTHHALRMAMGEAPQVTTVYNDQGQPVIERHHRTDLAATARLLDLLAKQLGMYKDDTSDAPPISINFDLSGANHNA